jgi:hypothetical protein
MGTRPQFLVDYRSFLSGDPFSETERVKTAAAPKKKSDDIVDAFLPDKDQFKALSKGIAFFKFNEDTAQSLFNAIGSVINLASGVMSVIGAYKSAVDFLTKVGILDAKTEVDQNIETILKNTQLLIDLAGAQMTESRRGWVDDWQSAIGECASQRSNVQTSRTYFGLKTLSERVADLDKALDKMLAFNTGNVFFQRAAYHQQDIGLAYDWTAILPTAYFDRRDRRLVAGGETVTETPDYKDPKSELRQMIWDPGFYIGVLIKAVGERLAATAVLEPAFRSTGWDRAQLRRIEAGLTSFISNWERSLLVANPAAGIDNEGMLHHPFDGDAPDGILIGAVDPVVGYSNLRNFPVLPIEFEKSEFIIAATGEGVYDSSKALDPQASLKAAIAEHARLVDQVILVSGIDSFRKLRAQVDKATRPPRTSDFATVERISYRLPNTIPIGTDETITLGRLARYAPDPHRKYPATRHIQGGNKQLQFFMPRRGEISGIQLGYALRFTDDLNAETIVDLINYDAMDSATASASPFPTKAITKTVTLDAKVLDCIQIRATTADEENIYERKGRIDGADRILINPRRKRIKLVVSATFEPDPDDKEVGQPNRGIVTVVIDPEDPNADPDATVLDIELLETRPDANSGEAGPVAVDAFDVTLVPSYLIVPKEMIDDVRKATERMAKTINGIHDKFGLEDMTPPDRNSIDPKKLRPDRFALHIESGIDFIDAAARHTDLEIGAGPELMTYTGATG